ncbi:MAG: methyltransferase domain-containing protein, partial [Gammaproteobacteria bacterium]|nr:methyltransferase domain-containing protein [Gammaproteobacteria bacterium]
LHDHAKVMIEDFDTDERFDLATLRMVAEHIADPPAVAKALSRLLLPGGRVIIFTVNRWSPITLISQAVPFSLHYPIKKFFWGGEEEDTFPVEYKMNTRKALQNLFAENGFVEESFAYLDDLSVFGHFKLMGYVELSLWRLINKLGLRYPENCLLGVYKKQ